jgi:anti-sigma regulatory factor (Ser/Thr protein kinase)
VRASDLYGTTTGTLANAADSGESDVMNPLHMKVLARAESAEEVRTVMRGWLAGRAAERELGDAELVLTELLTNSVRHAGLTADDVVRVRASEDGEVLHLEVEDDGRAGEPRRREPDPVKGGLGLNLVDTLALHWGVRHNGVTVVWADLPLSADRQPALL